ncbi:hypothetical protein BDFG_02670 [Blastomyces dermatitidis ATCC 26199]|nr:hypothetical protein BDFG_02670 [Blastomyces dermatitidis ATCC 26199]
MLIRYMVYAWPPPSLARTGLDSGTHHPPTRQPVQPRPTRPVRIRLSPDNPHNYFIIKSVTAGDWAPPHWAILGHMDHTGPHRATPDISPSMIRHDSPCQVITTYSHRRHTSSSSK